MTNLSEFINNPYRFIKKYPNSKLRYFLIPINWTFQGQLNTDKTEKAFKFFTELILMVTIYLILINFTSILMSLFLAFIFAHTINYFFNNNFLNIFTKNLGLSIRGFIISFNISYVNELQKRIKKENSIQCAAIYGSLSRNEFKETSDLDVRIIRKPGIINGFQACIFAFFERNRASINKFPLDLFVLDNTELLSKLRDDEVPIVLYDPEGILKKIYPRVTYFKI